MHFYRKYRFDPFEEQFISPFLSDCLSLGIAIHYIQHSQAMLERGVCELAHSFFHLDIRKVIQNSWCLYLQMTWLLIWDSSFNLEFAVNYVVWMIFFLVYRLFEACFLIILEMKKKKKILQLVSLELLFFFQFCSGMYF